MQRLESGSDRRCASHLLVPSRIHRLLLGCRDKLRWCRSRGPSLSIWPTSDTVTPHRALLFLKPPSVRCLFFWRKKCFLLLQYFLVLSDGTADRPSLESGRPVESCVLSHCLEKRFMLVLGGKNTGAQHSTRSHGNHPSLCLRFNISYTTWCLGAMIPPMNGLACQPTGPRRSSAASSPGAAPAKGNDKRRLRAVCNVLSCCDGFDNRIPPQLWGVGAARFHPLARLDGVNRPLLPEASPPRACLDSQPIAPAHIPEISSTSSSLAQAVGWGCKKSCA